MLLSAIKKTGAITDWRLELCDFVKDGSRTYKPSIQDRTQVHPDVAALLQDCWSENPEIRPSIRRVRLNTEHYLKV